MSGFKFDLRIAAFIIAAFGIGIFVHQALAVDSDGTLPDKILTPGVSRTQDEGATCSIRTSEVRNVTEAMKKAVRSRYGMSEKKEKWCANPEGCEIDHLIPLCAGGANDVGNLWPQPYQGEWNAHHKDQLEAKVCRMICDGKVSIKDVQTAISSNWIEAYKKWVNPTPINRRKKDGKPS